MNHRDNQETCPYCVGRDGRQKRAYRTRDEARDAAAYIYRCRGVRLREYQCDDTWRWHLTSDLLGGW